MPTKEFYHVEERWGGSGQGPQRRTVPARTSKSRCASDARTGVPSFVSMIRLRWNDKTLFISHLKTVKTKKLKQMV